MTSSAPADSVCRQKRSLMLTRSANTDTAAIEAVNDYLAEYGFQVKQTDAAGWIYLASDLWELSMGKTHRYLAVRMRLLSEAQDNHVLPLHAGGSTISGPNPVSTDPVDVFRILQVAAPRLKESERIPRPLSARPELGELVGQQLRLLADHCRPLLEGDLAMWREIRERERYGFGTRKLDGEPWQRYVRRLHETAEAAYRRGDYWESADYYAMLDWVGVKLSFFHRLRWWWAGQHIG
jgi:hypothetical protein